MRILRTLADSKVLSSKEISLKTQMSERTVRYALKVLKEKGFVEEVYILGDMRRRGYKLKST